MAHRKQGNLLAKPVACVRDKRTSFDARESLLSTQLSEMAKSTTATKQLRAAVARPSRVTGYASPNPVCATACGQKPWTPAARAPAPAPRMRPSAFASSEQSICSTDCCHRGHCQPQARRKVARRVLRQLIPRVALEHELRTDYEHRSQCSDANYATNGGR